MAHRSHLWEEALGAVKWDTLASLDTYGVHFRRCVRLYYTHFHKASADRSS
jgi:hypothetical protein